MSRSIRLLILMIFMCLTIMRAEPYKPKPILMIHGIGSNSSSWGASTKNPRLDRGELICKDSVDAHPEKTFAHFLPYMIPYVWTWYNWEKCVEFTQSVKKLHTFEKCDFISNAI